jgi:hypothetical protein
VVSRTSLLFLTIVVTSACSGDTTATGSAASAAAPLVAGGPATAQPATCPAGARCLMTDINGHSSPTAEFTAQCTGRFPDYVDLVPSGFAGRRFKLSQTYPASVPAASQTGPWLKIDFKTPAGAIAYLMALRAYIYEGMIAADFRPEDNQVRRWYHVPWMSPGKRPREFLRGMTEERPISGPELGIKTTHTVQNWAVGFYNDAGAVSIGKVWANAIAPDPGAGKFGAGTVVAKILFSAAIADDFTGPDLLAGSPGMDVNLVTDRKPLKKGIGHVRLLQMDVAAADPRATDTGWVFGTFAFDKDVSGNTGWDKMVPVGLMWGADPKLLPSSGQKPVETQVNPKAPAYALNHLGWAGRMNGPVDNPASSCLGCHSTAQVPNVLASMTPLRGCTDAQKLQWFRNLRGNVAFGAVDAASCLPSATSGQVVALDYSLQQTVALNAIALGQYVNPCTPAGTRGMVLRGQPAPGSTQKIYDVIR